MSRGVPRCADCKRREEIYYGIREYRHGEEETGLNNPFEKYYKVFAFPSLE